MGPSVRHLLHVDGVRTDFFTSTATRSAHRVARFKHSLYKAGSSPSGCALLLDAGSCIAPLKARAEQLALADKGSP